MVLCEALDDPENGTVTLPVESTVDSVATYECVDDFELVGDVNVTCLPSGVWSAGVPSCVGRYTTLEINYNKNVIIASSYT